MRITAPLHFRSPFLADSAAKDTPAAVISQLAQIHGLKTGDLVGGTWSHQTQHSCEKLVGYIKLKPETVSTLLKKAVPKGSSPLRSAIALGLPKSLTPKARKPISVELGTLRNPDNNLCSGVAVGVKNLDSQRRRRMRSNLNFHSGNPPAMGPLRYHVLFPGPRLDQL